MLMGVVIIQFLFLAGAFVLIRLLILKVKQLRKRIRRLGKINASLNKEILYSKYPEYSYSYSTYSDFSQPSTFYIEEPFVNIEQNIWAVLKDQEVLGRFSNPLDAESHLIQSKRKGLGQVYIAFDPDFKYGYASLI